MRWEMPAPASPPAAPGTVQSVPPPPPPPPPPSQEAPTPRGAAGALHVSEKEKPGCHGHPRSSQAHTRPSPSVCGAHSSPPPSCPTSRARQQGIRGHPQPTCKLCTSPWSPSTCLSASSSPRAWGSRCLGPGGAAQGRNQGPEGDVMTKDKACQWQVPAWKAGF